MRPSWPGSCRRFSLAAAKEEASHVYRSPADMDQTDPLPVARQSSSSAAPEHGRIMPPERAPRLSFATLRDQLSGRIAALDLAPDLGSEIGSKRWMRGFGTFVGLSAAAIALWPSFAPLSAAPAVPHAS